MTNASNGNCTNVDQLVKRYYLPVTYSIICVVGVVGNVTSLLVYMTRVRPWHSNSIIMVNLAISDLLYMFSLPSLVHYYLSDESWVLGDFACRFMRFGFLFNLYSSILFLTCLAVFRYVAVVHPLWMVQMQHKRWGVLVCVGAWTISALQMAPTLTMISTEQRGNKTHCLDLASNDPVDVWWYTWMLTALGYLLPLVVVCTCYLRIVCKLARRCQQLGSCMRTRARVQRLIVVVLMCLMICFLPYHVLRTLRVYTRMMPDVSCLMDRWVQALYAITRPLAGLNSIFNLPLYTLAGDRFKQAFLDLFKCTPCSVKSSSFVNVVSKPSSQNT
ncbi:2-oxoglutarate receptor 1-like [Chanos chanos]|uniref:2-oxoglutarate receptor 1-like n=1 Tax=Chanos chanos TaxID=29144 RepID=A0A6J2VSD7_CHACN|nr:2-oxoglutarate receptor 1-like [Chanos chanos]